MIEDAINGLMSTGGDVPERVQLLVGWHEVARLPDDRETDVADLRDELVDRELDPETWNGLQLVERPARVGEAPAGHLPERHAARGDDRPDRDRGSCLRLRRSGACRPPGSRAAPRSIVSPERIIASVSACVSRPVSSLK